jgi:hypothetical protein
MSERCVDASAVWRAKKATELLHFVGEATGTSTRPQGGCLAGICLLPLKFAHPVFKREV